MNGRQEVVSGSTSYNRSHTEAAQPRLPELRGRKIVKSLKAFLQVPKNLCDAAKNSSFSGC